MPLRSTHIDPASLRAVIERTGAAQVSIEAAWRAAIKAGGELWYKIAQESIGATDHSLDQLAKLDHPYARRHGSIQIHQGHGFHLTDTTNLVHNQSDNMLHALVGHFDEDAPTGPSYSVSLDPGVAPEVRFVLKGTKRQGPDGGVGGMLPRDPLASAALAPQTQDDIRSVIVQRLQRRFGTTVSMRFS